MENSWTYIIKILTTQLWIINQKMKIHKNNNDKTIWLNFTYVYLI